VDVPTLQSLMALVDAALEDSSRASLVRPFVEPERAQLDRVASGAEAALIALQIMTTPGISHQLRTSSTVDRVVRFVYSHVLQSVRPRVVFHPVPSCSSGDTTDRSLLSVLCS
jgi:hypothetical protein